MISGHPRAWEWVIREGQHPCQQPWTLCPPLPRAQPSQDLGRRPDLPRLSREAFFRRVPPPSAPALTTMPCRSGENACPRGTPGPSASLTEHSGADGARPQMRGARPGAHAARRSPRLGLHPPSTGRSLRPVRGRCAGAGRPAATTLARIRRAARLKRQARFPIPARRHGQQPCGRGAAWSGHRLRTPARPASTARSRKAPRPGVPFSLAVPRVSLAPHCPPTEGVCPARAVCLAHWADGLPLTPRPCPSPGFGWALPQAWALLTGSWLLPGLVLRETGGTL